MPRVAKTVPGFLHISLFLFFAGLAVSLMNINTKVALTTIVPIGISSLLYIFTIFVPIIYPQSPYQNSFSSILWYLIQKLRGWRFRPPIADADADTPPPRDHIMAQNNVEEVRGRENIQGSRI
jgi:hypothetical protein